MDTKITLATLASASAQDMLSANPLKEIEFHHASDRRCYYGAPSSDLQKEWNSIDEARKILEANKLSITYFPNGGFYVGFKRHQDKAPEILTPDCSSFENCYRALIDAVNKEPCAGS